MQARDRRRELARIVRADPLVVDELELLPLDAEGARLLFQAVSQAYEAQSVVFTTPCYSRGNPTA